MAPREPKGKKKLESTVSFLTDKEQFESLEYAKFYFQKSKGDILRVALAQYLEKNFPENVQKKVKNLLKK